MEEIKEEIKEEFKLEGHVFIVGEWAFEIKSLLGRKATGKEKDYTGAVNVTVTDGMPHFEGLVCSDYGIRDRRTFFKLVKKVLQLKGFEFKRFKDGEQRKHIKKQVR